MKEITAKINSMGLFNEDAHGHFKLQERSHWEIEYFDKQGKTVDKFDLPFEREEETKAFAQGILWREHLQKLLDHANR